MEIDQNILHHIARHTRCQWTRGYVERALEEITPTGEEIAKELIDSHGPSAKIQAIKMIRQNYGLGLKEAKHLVDEYYRSGKIVGLPPEAPF